jgi:hypothetical protein
MMQDSATGRNDITYKNMPVIISKFTEAKKTIIEPIKFCKTNPSLVTAHGEISFAAEDKYVIPLRKGWPAVGTSDTSLADPFLNPFTDSFYTYCPVAEITGPEKSYGYFGRLSDFYVKHRLGYYYNYISAAGSGKYFALVEKTLGEINIYPEQASSAEADPLFSFGIFKEKLSAIKTRQPSTFSSKMEYMRSFEKELFASYIMDYLPEKETMHILVKQQHTMRYCQYAVNGRLIKQTDYQLQNAPALKHCRFFRKGSHLYIAGVEQQGRDFTLNYMKIK